MTPSDNKQWDVLGIGNVTVDDMLYVQRFPDPDVKTRVLDRRRQVGGLTAVALMTAARLGARCSYAAVMGHDELSQYARQQLEQAGVNTAHVVYHDDAHPVHATIIVGQDDHTRSIFFDPSGRVGADDQQPTAATIQQTRVLFLDMYGMVGNLRAAKIAREVGIPVIGDFEHADVPRLDELLPLVDHLIVGQRFALAWTGAADVPAAVAQLWSAERSVVVVTCGAAGAYYRSVEQPLQHQAAFPVPVVDTTGCGDVFHGAYAAQLARGIALPERVRYASAAAALKATGRGTTGIPDAHQVERLLKEHGV